MSVTRSFRDILFVAGCSSVAYQYINKGDAETKTKLLVEAAATIAFSVLGRLGFRILVKHLYKKTKVNGLAIRGVNEFGSCLRGGALAVYCDMTVGTIAHEYGHRIARHLLFKNIKTSIQYSLTRNSSCYAQGSFDLSRMGSVIGEDAATGCVAAAGPLVTTIIGAVAAHIFANNIVFPVLKWDSFKVENERTNELEKRSFFGSMMLSSFCYMTMYALSAKSPQQDTGHDFEGMWKGIGIKPNVAIAGMAGINAIALAAPMIKKFYQKMPNQRVCSLLEMD